MSRRSARTTFVVAVTLLAVTVSNSSGQSPTPGGWSGEFELVRGLRENGMPDLALSYLEDLAKNKDKKDDPTIKSQLPLELARTQLELAEVETDEGKREGLMNLARKGFTAFLNDPQTKDHPRRPEAAISMGRLTSLSARAALSRAANIQEEDKWKAASAATRPEFENAVKQYNSAVKALDGLIANANPQLKKQLEREKISAELETAIAQYQIFRTYVKPTIQEIGKRGEAIQAAIKLFEGIVKAYPTSSAAAISQAWIGQCYLQLDDPLKAKEAFEAVKKNRSNPNAAAGVRMVRFFEARQKFESVLGGWSDKALGEAFSAISGWLNEYGGGFQTNEHFNLRYSYGTLKQMQAIRACKLPKDGPKTPIVTDQARDYFRQAERAFARVTSTDNDYSERAAKKRTECIRMIVGDGDQKISNIKQFDEAVMTGLVQFDKFMKAPDDAAKKASINRVIALFEHALTLPAPNNSTGAEFAKEVLDTKLRLVFAYLVSGNETLAAVYGENLARSTRGSSGAKAGLYAIRAYLSAMNKYLKGDPQRSTKPDKDRVMTLSSYLDREFPSDPATDSARIVLGQMINAEGKNKEAFDVLSRVSPGSPQLSTARFHQGLAAFSILRDKDRFTEKEKDAVLRRIINDINAVPPPVTTATAEDAAMYIRLRLLLSQLEIINGDTPQEYAKAEQTAANAAALLDPRKYPNLSEGERSSLQFSAEENRLRAIYGQVAGMYKDGKYAEVMERLAPALGDIAQVIGAHGSSVKMVNAMTVPDDIKELIRPNAQKLDDYRREAIIVLALQTAIRLADIPKAKALFGMLRQLGGSTEASVNALTQLVRVVRPQIERLRREGKADEAKKLVDGIAQVLAIIEEKELTPRVRVFLGRSLKDLGAYDKGARILALVPKPTPATDLDMPIPKVKEAGQDRYLAVIFYRGAQIEYARALRLDKKFGEAEKVLKDALGDDKLPKPVPGTGWAKGSPDFEKELLFLKEDMAEADSNPKNAVKLWKEALDGWAKFAGKYRPMIAALGGGKKGPKEALMALVKIKQQLPPHELLPKNASEINADVIRDGKAPWVVEMLKEKVTQVDPDTGDAVEVPNPYWQELQAVITRLETQVKPLYYDAFYEYNRCLCRANSSLLKSNPAKLNEQFGKIANTLKDLETQNPDLSPDVRTKFTDLIDDYPALKKPYADAGGKMFLQPRPQPTVSGGGN